MASASDSWHVTSKLILLHVLLLLLTFGAHCQAIADRRCGHMNNNGTCISLKHCSPLLKTISPENITPDAIRQLQKLTCGFDKNEPRVCCPSKNLKVIEPEPTTTQAASCFKDHPNYSLLPKLDVCGQINSTLGNRIIGGSIPPHGSQPWLARIGYDSGKQEDAYYCGGTLITSRYVLTAAHCVIGEDDAKPVSVSLGEYDVENEPDCSPETGKCSTVVHVKVEKIISHSNYNSDVKQNDIALIRLAEEVQFTEFVKPACLPTQKEFKPEIEALGSDENSEKTSYGFVAGWGSVKWNVLRESAVVRFVYLPIVTNEKCQDIYSRRTFISTKQMCAGGEYGKDSCDGDSGGPLMYFSNAAKRFFQVGIVSYGPTRCGSGGLPGIYTRITEYMDWILDTIES